MVGCVYATVASEFGVAGIAPASLDSGFLRAWQTKGSFDYSRAAWFEVVRRNFGNHAARAWRLPPGAILPVGDNARKDPEGAAVAGLQTLLLARRARGHTRV